MKKRIAIFLLIGILLLSLTACSSSELPHEEYTYGDTFTFGSFEITIEPYEEVGVLKMTHELSIYDYSMFNGSFYLYIPITIKNTSTEAAEFDYNSLSFDIGEWDEKEYFGGELGKPILMEQDFGTEPFDPSHGPSDGLNFVGSIKPGESVSTRIYIHKACNDAEYICTFTNEEVVIDVSCPFNISDMEIPEGYTDFGTEGQTMPN